MYNSIAILAPPPPPPSPAMGLPLKLAVVSATVLSTALMFNLSTPFVTQLAISDLPTIWTSLISWLKPPYLYVVINCIIITIVASSRLQSKHDVSYSTYTPSTEPVLVDTASVGVLQPVEEFPPVHKPEIPFNNGVSVNEQVNIACPEPVKGSEPVITTPPGFSYEDMKIATKAYEEMKKSRVNKSLISMSAWTPTKIDQVDLSFPVEKPPASARFNHRKPAKPTSEGVKTLKVSKPKRQDTLETTWKTITEGRSVPLTRHLRKSDTFESHGQGHGSYNSNELSSENHSERMTKSDEFEVGMSGGGGSRKPPPSQSKLSRAGGPGKLKKDPSLGQEELNRKVEAFIKKFNEDMRLQRQESLNQYMEMINRGAH